MRTICLFFAMIAMVACAHDAPPSADDSTACVDHCFDPQAATRALDQAVVDMRPCAHLDASEKSGHAEVTFEPSGQVSNVVLDAHLEHSALAECIKTAFRQGEVPAFQGEPQTVAKVFSIGGVEEGVR